MASVITPSSEMEVSYMKIHNSSISNERIGNLPRTRTGRFHHLFQNNVNPQDNDQDIDLDDQDNFEEQFEFDLPDEDWGRYRQSANG